MFKNPLSSNGRIRRLEYGISYMIFLIACFMLDGLLMEFGHTMGIAINLLINLLYIPPIWFILLQGAKRSHDLGTAGWWQIIPFYLFWMLFKDGQPCSNEYGENPKNPISSIQ